jgi:hypothetical protein
VCLTRFGGHLGSGVCRVDMRALEPDEGACRARLAAHLRLRELDPWGERLQVSRRRGSPSRDGHFARAYFDVEASELGLLHGRTVAAKRSRFPVRVSSHTGPARDDRRRWRQAPRHLVTQLVRPGRSRCASSSRGRSMSGRLWAQASLSSRSAWEDGLPGAAV